MRVILKILKNAGRKKKPGVVCNRFHMGEREGKIIVLGIFPIVGPRGATQEDGMLFITILLLI